MGLKNYQNGNTKTDEVKFVAAEVLGKIDASNEKWVEVSVGHYEKGGLAMFEDKMYIMHKYTNKDGDERTSKAIGLEMTQIEALAAILDKFVNED